MSRTSLRLVVASLVAAAVLLPGAAGFADCAQDERSLERRIEDAEAVFLGTVAELTNRDRTATFDVEEIWKPTGEDAGDVPPVGPEVVVHGGPDEANAATSVDRTWEAGRRYLVFPRAEDGRFVDDICTSTRPWTDDLSEARPGDAREVTREAAGDGDLDAVAVATSAPWIIVGVTVLAVGVAGAYALSRRR